MNNRLETALNIVMAIAAVAVATVVVRKHVREPQSSVSAEVAELKPVYVDRWQAMLADGLTLGPAAAQVRIVEFTDFECPYCAQWHLTTLKEVLKEHGADVALTVMHSPIPSHRFAKQAAVAVECAAAQGSLSRFLDVIYAKQDSIGLKPWMAYALESQVADSAKYSQCVSAPPSPRIAAGLRWAHEVQVNATPTFLLNGWRLPRAPSSVELSKAIRLILARQQPF